jgi:arylsulfatase A-like enzyme
MERNSERPFFLYLAHVMPHVPIFASEKFRGRSGAGLYADVMEELDWSVGEVLGALKRLKLEQNTLVVFISDNGPFLYYGEHAGSARPLREGKLTVFEGGVRVPCIARWIDKVPARVSNEPFMAIDWMPTLAEIVNGKAGAKKIDGRSIKPLLFGERNAKSPQEAYYFYSGTELQAIRSGPWKMHFPHPYLTVMAEPGRDGKPSGWGKLTPKSMDASGVEGIASRHGYRVEQMELSLFNLEEDVGETRNVAAENPEIVRKLSEMAIPIRQELGDSLQNITGKGVRDVGLDSEK